MSDAIIAECQRRAERYAGQVRDGAATLSSLSGSVGIAAGNLDLAVLSLTRTPLQESTVLDVKAAVDALGRTVGLLAEVMTHVGQVSEFGRMQLCAFEQRQRELAVLLEARDLSESQITAGGFDR